MDSDGDHVGLSDSQQTVADSARACRRGLTVGPLSESLSE